MKLFAKLLILALIAAMAGPFFIRGPDGQPLMRIGDVMQTIKRWTGSVGSSGAGGQVEVHRWQDENGQWHYSDEAPAENSEVITLDPNTNVIQSVPVNKPPAAPTETRDEPPPVKADEPPPVFNAVDETNKVKEELEKRNELLKKRLDDT